MGSKLAAWTCGWAALLVVAGCGKSEGSAEPIPQSELPTRVANLLCDSLASCCKTSGFALDTAGCKTAYITELQDDLGDNNQPGVRYDAQAAGDCLAAVSSQVQCGQLEGEEVAACERIFIGSVAPGQPCTASRQCAPVAGQSVYCESTDGAAPSVCTASGRSTAPRGKLGDACTTTCFEGESCSIGLAPVPTPAPGGVPQPQPDPVGCYRDDGLFCDAGLCAPLDALGAPCSSYDSCRGTAFCKFDTGLCTAPQPDGSPCDTNNACQSGNCEDSEPVVDPAVVASRVCVSATTTTARQCEQDFTDTSTDASDPGSSSMNPEASPGTP